MDEPTDIEMRRQRFTEAARAFMLPSPSRHAKLAPFVEGIVELRQKGASLRLIRELLATIGVAVGTDTIARFLADMNGDPTSPHPPKRISRQRASAARQTHPRPAAVAAAPAAPVQSKTPPLTPDAAQPADAPTDRSRSRGPRIADPRNL